MSKQEYYYDKLDFRHYTIRSNSKNLETADIEQLLLRYVKGTNACLHKFVEEGHFEELARMYAKDRKSVTARTVEVRKLYQKRFELSLLPDCYQRRLIDIMKARVQAVLPGAAQRLVIASYLEEHPDETDNEATRALYRLIIDKKRYQVKAPNAQLVGNVRRQMAKADGSFSLPRIMPDFGDCFSFSHGDSTMSTVKRQGGQIIFRSGYQGKTYEIIFEVPNKTRYQTGKVCLPDISTYIDENERERVMFSFSIKHTAPKQYDCLCSLGVDVGEVYPFVCSAVGSNWHSQGFYPGKEILDLVDKMNDISFQISVLDLKIKQDSVDGRRNLNGWSLSSRVERLRVERERLCSKRTRLKKEIAHQTAHRVCSIAVQCRAEVVLERLNWSNPKHAFYHALIQDAIRNRCLSLGVPIRMVPARGSSAWSPENGSVLVQGIRHGAAASRGKGCSRNSWRTVDGASGLRDAALRHKSASRSGVDVEAVSFSEVVGARDARASVRGARDRVSGCVRDHDYVGSLNLGVRGVTARRGDSVLSACLGGSFFARLRFSKSCRGELALAAPGSVVPSGIASGSFSLVGLCQSSLGWLSQQGSPIPAVESAACVEKPKE